MSFVKKLARQLGIDSVVLVKVAVWYFCGLSKDRQFHILEDYFRAKTRHH